MTRSYRTLKGTILPLLLLRGKEYLEVKYRIVWFREEHPDWRILTELIEHGVDTTTAKASIVDANGVVMATSHKTEDKKGFPDHMEKAETGAIGRALALCGFGTSFTGDELSEGERIVDSPNEPKASASKAVATASKPASAVETHRDGPVDHPGEYVIEFGKHKGKKIKAIDSTELQSYIGWCVDQSQKKNQNLSHSAATLKIRFEQFMSDMAEKANLDGQPLFDDIANDNQPPWPDNP